MHGRHRPRRERCRNPNPDPNLNRNPNSNPNLNRNPNPDPNSGPEQVHNSIHPVWVARLGRYLGVAHRHYFDSARRLEHSGDKVHHRLGLGLGLGLGFGLGLGLGLEG